MYQNPIERAFELARSGRYAQVEQIRRQLIRESYDGVENHLRGRLIRRQLRQVCLASAGIADAPLGALA